MLMMEKGGKKKFVFDCFISHYRDDGWNVIGEADAVQPPLSSTPEVEDDLTDSAVEESESDTECFDCPHCGKSYQKESSLKAHIKKSHAEA